MTAVADQLNDSSVDVTASYNSQTRVLTYRWPVRSGEGQNLVVRFATQLDCQLNRGHRVSFGHPSDTQVMITFGSVAPDDAACYHTRLVDCMFRAGLLDTPFLPLS